MDDRERIRLAYWLLVETKELLDLPPSEHPDLDRFWRPLFQVSCDMMKYLCVDNPYVSEPDGCGEQEQKEIKTDAR